MAGDHREQYHGRRAIWQDPCTASLMRREARIASRRAPSEWDARRGAARRQQDAGGPIARSLAAIALRAPEQPERDRPTGEKRGRVTNRASGADGDRPPSAREAPRQLTCSVRGASCAMAPTTPISRSSAGSTSKERTSTSGPPPDRASSRADSAPVRRIWSVASPAVQTRRSSSRPPPCRSGSDIVPRAARRHTQRTSGSGRRHVRSSRRLRGAVRAALFHQRSSGCRRTFSGTVTRRPNRFSSEPARYRQ